MYHGKYCVDDEEEQTFFFKLKNQRIVFEPPLSEPLSPFFLYKKKVYNEIKTQNPDMKATELTSLIAQTWNGLDEEKQSLYRKKHEKMLATYQGIWEVPLKTKKKNLKSIAEEEEINQKGDLSAPKDKKAKITQKSRYLTHVFKCIHHDVYISDMNKQGIAEAQQFEYKNCWKPNETWLDALAFIKKKYLKIRKEYDSLRVSLIGEKSMYYGIQQNGPPTLEFNATIIDYVKGEATKISDYKLQSEISKQIQRLPQAKKYLIVDIMREKNFNPRAIRDVLSILPEHEINFNQRKKKSDSEVDDSEVDDSEVDDSEVDDSEVDDSEVDDSEVDDSEVDDDEFYEEYNSKSKYFLYSYC